MEIPNKVIMDIFGSWLKKLKQYEEKCSQAAFGSDDYVIQWHMVGYFQGQMEAIKTFAAGYDRGLNIELCQIEQEAMEAEK